MTQGKGFAKSKMTAVTMKEQVLMKVKHGITMNQILKMKKIETVRVMEMVEMRSKISEKSRKIQATTMESQTNMMKSQIIMRKTQTILAKTEPIMMKPQHKTWRSPTNMMMNSTNIVKSPINGVKNLPNIMRTDLMRSPIMKVFVTIALAMVPSNKSRMTKTGILNQVSKQ
jgi:hypothetical protein